MTHAALTQLAARAGTPALREALRATQSRREALQVMGIDPDKVAKEAGQ
jgi:hypothetical protein